MPCAWYTSTTVLDTINIQNAREKDFFSCIECIKGNGEAAQSAQDTGPKAIIAVAPGTHVKRLDPTHTHTIDSVSHGVSYVSSFKISNLSASHKQKCILMENLTTFNLERNFVKGVIVFLLFAIRTSDKSLENTDRHGYTITVYTGSSQQPTYLALQSFRVLCLVQSFRVLPSLSSRQNLQEIYRNLTKQCHAWKSHLCETLERTIICKCLALTFHKTKILLANSYNFFPVV